MPFMVWSPRRTRAGVAAIAISSALLVAACGSSGSIGASSSSAAAQIVIGAALPLTGSAASYGAIMKDGMQLAVNEINASGGIHGAKLKVDYVDSCQTSFPSGGGATVVGPWINTKNKTWNATSKVHVKGSVKWPSASFRVTVSGGRRHIKTDDLLFFSDAF